MKRNSVLRNLLLLIGIFFMIPFKAAGQNGGGTATCADVIAGEDGTVFRVTGTCTRIANWDYGNWYLADETGEIYIYGTLDKDGNAGKNQSIDAWGIEVGDIITVEGPKTTYNGKVELVNVTVMEIKKSMMTVYSVIPEDATIAVSGGDVQVTLLYRGSDCKVNIPDEAKGWLSITEHKTELASPTRDRVTFHADSNSGEARSATIVFTTTFEGTSYMASLTITQESSVFPVSVAEFLNADVGGTKYRLTGIIVDTYPADKQDKSFYLQDYSGRTLVYRLDGFQESGAAVGDVVSIVGERGAYNNTPEMVKGTFEELKYKVQPISIADFLKAPDSKEVYYMVTGTITSVANATYGNLYISDGTNELYVYGCYPGWGATGDNRKNLLATAGIEVGDLLTVIGTKSTYNDVIELYNGIYFSHVSASGILPIRDAGNPTASPVYNLSGQRMTAPRKGIYIMDGKKVVVK